jgi:gliding motility-associated-like protein
VDAGPDQWILEGQRATLAGTASNGNGLIFAWTPSVSLSDPTSLRPVATPLNSTRYLLKVTTDKGCSDTSSAMVTVLLIPEIPNTFTPNGDGVNDRWEIRNLDRYPGAVVEVYNTMGALVYRSSGYSQPWDGTHAGRQLPAGTYYYVVHPRYGREKKAGYVTILR